MRMRFAKKYLLLSLFILHVFAHQVHAHEIIPNEVDKFAAALDREDLDEAREIARNASDIDVRDRSRKTFLIVATRHEAAPADFLEELIRLGASVTLRVPNGKFPLEIAAWAGDLDKVKTLVNAGSPLGDSVTIARRHGFFEIEKYLTTPEVQEREALQNSLFAAARAGDLEGVRGMILAGGRVTARNAGGATVLQSVLRGDPNPALIEFLLDTAEREGGSLPPGTLTRVARNGSVEVARLLVERGASVDGEQGSGLGPPLLLAARAGNLPMVDFLLEKGADPEPVWFGGNALAWAENEFRHEVVERLKQAGASAIDRDLRSPLYGATDPDRIRELLEAGADPDPPADAGATPLTEALQRCRLEVAGLLIEAGADVNRSSEISHSRPPLIYAIDRCRPEERSRRMVEFLLEHGADPNAERFDGRSALERARARERSDIEALLLQYGASVE